MQKILTELFVVIILALGYSLIGLTVLIGWNAVLVPILGVGKIGFLMSQLLTYSIYIVLTLFILFIIRLRAYWCT